jgi:hypothetical protein
MRTEHSRLTINEEKWWLETDDTPDPHRLAEELGLLVGKGTYNNQTFWVRPDSSAIITAERVLELAGY